MTLKKSDQIVICFINQYAAQQWLSITFRESQTCLR